MTKPSLHIRLLLVIVLVVLAATGAYVFTASNTVPNTNAGSGSGTISGYTISGVAYNLNSSNPEQHRQRRLHDRADDSRHREDPGRERRRLVLVHEHGRQRLV